MVQSLPVNTDDRLLIGAESFSDASAYQLDDGSLMVQSLDFFPPLVDDPFIYGQIAAANSLSDLFAMGATPQTALNIVGFPDDKLDLSILTEILRGGDEKVREAGAVTAGGHTVRDAEIKYGLSVTGTCHPDRLLHNSNAQPGDVLILTKPLGTGFLTTASKAGKCSASDFETTVKSMCLLNANAASIAQDLNASSVTDITGFGLAGHAVEMANGSNTTLTIQVDLLPVLPGAIGAYQQGHVTRASNSNREANSAQITGLTDVDIEQSELLFDPQTSGGLLVSIPSQIADQYLRRVNDLQPVSASLIGEVTERGDVAIVVK